MSPEEHFVSNGKSDKTAAPSSAFFIGQQWERVLPNSEKCGCRTKVRRPLCRHAFAKVPELPSQCSVASPSMAILRTFAPHNAPEGNAQDRCACGWSLIHQSA